MIDTLQKYEQLYTLLIEHNIIVNAEQYTMLFIPNINSQSNKEINTIFNLSLLKHIIETRENITIPNTLQDYLKSKYGTEFEKQFRELVF